MRRHVTTPRSAPVLLQCSAKTRKMNEHCFILATTLAMPKTTDINIV
jgi:hypothetical protein